MAGVAEERAWAQMENFFEIKSYGKVYLATT